MKKKSQNSLMSPHCPPRQHKSCRSVTHSRSYYYFLSFQRLRLVTNTSRMKRFSRSLPQEPLSTRTTQKCLPRNISLYLKGKYHPLFGPFLAAYLCGWRLLHLLSHLELHCNVRTYLLVGLRFQECSSL